MTAAWRHLLGAEWRKVTTTKMLWVLGLVGVAYSVVNAGTLVLLAAQLFPGLPTGTDDSMLLDPDYVTSVIAQAGTAATFVLILGIIAVTGEYRHMTITSTFLATPRRGRVLVAKMGLYGLLGALIALVTTVVVAVVVAVALVPFDHAPVTPSALLAVLVGAAFGFALYAIVGVSLGALVKSQIAAIIIALVWVLLLEGIVGLVFPSVGRWLPGGALKSVMDVSVTTDMSGQLVDAERLPAWGGALVLLAYAALFGLIAMRTTLRRDIT